MSDVDCDIDCPDCGDCDCDCNCLCCYCCCYDDGSWGDNRNGSSAGYGTSDTKRRRRRCLLTILFLLFVVTVLVLIFAFAIVRPVRLAVEEASLAHLALAGPNGTVLAYDVSLAVAVCNPNWTMHARLRDPLDAELLFAGERFATIRMMHRGIIQPRKTEVYNVAAAGESATPLGSAGVAEFGKESATGGVFRLS